MIQHVIRNQGGTIYLDHPTRLTSPKVSVFDGAGNTLVDNQNSTSSTISTTLASAVDRKASTLSVVSATGISAGSSFWLSGGSKVAEEVICKSISGTTITLLRPTTHAHAVSSTVQGHRVTYAMGSAEASKSTLKGFAIWYDGTTVVANSALTITKIPLLLSTTYQDLLDEDESFALKLGSYADVNRLLDRAWLDVLKILQARTEMSRLIRASGRAFNMAVVFCVMRNFYRSQSDDRGEVMFQRYQKMLSDELAAVIAQLPPDSDEDGNTVNEIQPSFYSIKLRRA